MTVAVRLAADGNVGNITVSIQTIHVKIQIGFEGSCFTNTKVLALLVQKYLLLLGCPLWCGIHCVRIEFLPHSIK